MVGPKRAVIVTPSAAATCIAPESLLTTARHCTSTPASVGRSVWPIRSSGRKAGPALFNRPRSRFFNPAHLRRAHDFYEKHGGKTIILARFMPIIRTFAPVVAGMGKMEYRRFLSFNVFGGLLWVLSMTLIGYYLGHFAWVRKNIELVIIIVVFLSILPGLIAFAREWWRKRRAAV